MTQPLQQPGEKPTTTFCRRAAAIRWLQISEEAWDGIVRAGVIEPVYLKPGSRAYFRTNEIEKKLINPS